MVLVHTSVEWEAHNLGGALIGRSSVISGGLDTGVTDDPSHGLDFIDAK
jgi:hypothetical protein